MAIYSDPESLKQRQEDMRNRMEARKEQARMGGKSIRTGRHRLKVNEEKIGNQKHFSPSVAGR